MAYQNPVPDIDDQANDANLETELDYKPMEDVYFAFIDVLGFKRTFSDIKSSNEAEITKKFSDVFNYYFALMNAAKFMGNGRKTGCYAGQTSDSLYFYTERPDYLLEFIKIFSHFSLYAMSKDVFFRGGISKGRLFKKEKYQFYGECVIGAYLLESNISKNPIIVIDENTHKDLTTINGYSNLVAEKQNRHYIKPFELLGKLSLDIDEHFSLKDINIECIEDNIKNNQRVFEYDADNYAKYVFLLNEYQDRNK